MDNDSMISSKEESSEEFDKELENYQNKSTEFVNFYTP